jgi:predicted aminopeptidase
VKNIFRKILLLGITILTIFLVVKWDLVRYGWQQARGQFHIMYEAKPLKFYLNDASFPDSLKAKIRLVKAATSFAHDELGFSSESQYQKMYNQNGKESMWVVTAASPYTLDSYEWKFPV